MSNATLLMVVADITATAETRLRNTFSLFCGCSFWKYVTTLDRTESRRYLEMLYHTKLRPLIGHVPEAVNQPLQEDGDSHFF